MISQFSRYFAFLYNLMPLPILRIIKFSHAFITIIPTMDISDIALRTKSKCLSRSKRVVHFYFTPSIIDLFVRLELGSVEGKFCFHRFGRYCQIYYMFFIFSFDKINKLDRVIFLVRLFEDRGWVFLGWYYLGGWALLQQLDQITLGIQSEMFYSSKTEALDQQNFSPNYFFEQPTMTQGYVSNELALSKAISIIQELKQNLSFALKLNQLLTQENQQLKSNAERTTKKINADAQASKKQLNEIQTQKQETISLLEETERTLLETEQQYQQTRRQLQKCQRIIYQQKKAYEELQQNYMNQSINYAGETSVNLNKSDLHYITEIEKQNHELQLQIKRLNQQLEKSQLKSDKFENENIEFRKWMASALGLQKVVEGSQKILMKQISKRISTA